MLSAEPGTQSPQYMLIEWINKQLHVWLTAEKSIAHLLVFSQQPQQEGPWTPVESLISVTSRVWLHSVKQALSSLETLPPSSNIISEFLRVQKGILSSILNCWGKKALIIVTWIEGGHFFVPSIHEPRPEILIVLVLDCKCHLSAGKSWNS